MEISVNLQRLRRAAHLSQAALAKASGVSQQLISQIERGENETTKCLPALARALGRSVYDIDPNYAPDHGAITQVPLLDAVAAGRLASPSSQIPVEDVPLLAFADLGRGDFFALKVQGDSMDRLSPEGSIIVINRADRTLVSGRCYVFAIRGETTYKRWQDGDPPYLAPFSTNPQHQPIFPKRRKDLEVIGRVRRTLMDL